MTALVRSHLGAVDDETVRVVTALSGLLAAIAYADRDYSPDEEARVRRELGRIHGMTEAGIDAICQVLRAHVVEISTVQLPRYAREINELGDRELRSEVLTALVEIAAADGEITTVESNLLRTVTTALGLTQTDYNAAQAAHRDKLAVLKSRE